MPASGLAELRITWNHFFVPPMYRFLFATLLLSACAFAADDIWRSDGYGLVLEIQGQKISAFEITSVSCIPVSADDGKLLPGGSAEERRIHFEGAAADVVLHRVAAKPKACEKPTVNTPESNYAVFWQTFAENYPFFEMKHVDWQAVDKRFRPRVTAETKPEELFAILQEMIEPLQDAHTGIGARAIHRAFHGMRPDPNHLTGDAWQQARDVMAAKYLQGEMQSFCNGHVRFGMLRDGIAYMRVDSFNSYASGGYAAETAALTAALDAGFRDTHGWRGLVIDVRRNTGGADPWGIDIAARLTGAKYLAYSKQTRDNLDGPLHFTAPQECWVVPSTRPGYRGPVVLLTGPDTISAGETFTMALMGREPHATRIGANTQGVFSDVLGRKLPNGWQFGLPNEVYLTKDGKAFDGPGIPPDENVPYFSAADLAAGRDAALDRAIIKLSNIP